MQASIIKKLETIVERHSEVGALLADAETIANQDRYRQLSKEYAQLSPVVETFSKWQQADIDLASAEEMLRDPDPAMKNMAEEEIGQGAPRYYYTVVYGPYYIWGATAGMLVNLSEILEA